MNSKFSHSAQTGSALIVSLVMLLLISLIGVGSMQGTILQERMASNLHDRNIAFQASERALRRGENWLTSNTVVAGTNTNDSLLDPGAWGGGGGDEVTVVTGDAQLSANPSYHVVRTGDACVGVGAGVIECYERYVVTSHGQGGTATSVAILQSAFMPEPP